LKKAIHLKADFTKPYNNIDVVYFVKRGCPVELQNYKNVSTIDSKTNKALNYFSVICKKWE
tara:strand:- start:212 stop:394 length:183 start_codon:yes stop_codon:yes gene_type:complete